MKNILILFFLFFSINVYATEKWTLKDIYINKLNNTSRIEVLNYIRSCCKYDIIDHKDMDNIVHRLLETKKFKFIKIIEYKHYVIFKCTERPVICSVDFFNNTLTLNNISKTMLQHINNVKGKSFHADFLNFIKQEIKKYFIDKKKKNVKTKLIVFFAHHNLISLKIILSELQNYTVEKISVFGNNDFSKKKILSLLELKNSSSWWYKKKQLIYCIKKLQKDIKKIKEFYINHGYIYFVINRVNVICSVKNKVKIQINYTEGKKYNITNVFLNGNIVLYFKNMNESIQTLIKRACCIKNIMNLKNDIYDIFLMHGYVDTKISINYVIKKLNNEILLYFYINSGQPYVLHKIYFYDNKHIKYIEDSILRHEIKNLEDHTLNIKLLNKLKSNIIKKRHYKNILLALYPTDYASNKIDAVYTVQKNNTTDTGSINFNFGYGLHNGMSLDFKLSQKDLFGSGINIKLNSLKNSYESSSSLTLTDPNFSTMNNILQGKFIYNKIKSNLTQKNIYNNKNYGFDSNLGFIVNARNNINIGVGFMHHDFFNQQLQFSVWDYSKYLEKDLEQLNLKKIKINNINLNILWNYNSLNSPYYPISGNYTTVSLKSTLPIFNKFFYVMQLDTMEYFPLKIKNNLILLVHANLGLKSHTTLRKFAIDENFFAGGMSTIRGFKTNSISPKFIYYNPLKNICIGEQNYKFCKSNDFLGGNTMIITNIELIAPISLKNNSFINIMRASIFFDSASIWNVQWIPSLDSTLSNLFNYNNPNKIRISTGVSLQWQSPLGPLQCSYSYPINFFNEDQIEQFQFNIGKNW